MHAPTSPPHPADALSPRPTALGVAAFRVLGWTLRGGTAVLAIAGLTGLAGAALGVLHQAPPATAAAMQQWGISSGVGSAVVVMITAAARAGMVERHRRVMRERQREAAERARLEAFRAREAARDVEAREAAARAAAAQVAAEAAARAAAAMPSRSDPAPDELEKILERARADRERREEEERIETAIRTGTRAA